MEHPNLDTVQALLGGFVTGDADRLRAGFAPDIRLESSGFDSTAGTYEGPDAVIGYFFAGDHMDDYRLEVIDMLASDERVAIVGRTFGRRGERTIENDFVQVLRLVDGLVTEIRIFAWDQKALYEFRDAA